MGKKYSIVCRAAHTRRAFSRFVRFEFKLFDPPPWGRIAFFFYFEYILNFRCGGLESIEPNVDYESHGALYIGGQRVPPVGIRFLEELLICISGIARNCLVIYEKFRRLLFDLKFYSLMGSGENAENVKLEEHFLNI
jgi:hypothetical protein